MSWQYIKLFFLFIALMLAINFALSFRVPEVTEPKQVKWCEVKDSQGRMVTKRCYNN